MLNIKLLKEENVKLPTKKKSQKYSLETKPGYSSRLSPKQLPESVLKMHLLFSYRDI